MKILLLIALFAVSTVAQSPEPKNSVSFNGIYVRENTTLTPSGAALEYRPSSDSVGFEFALTRRVLGPVSFGMEIGVTFHTKDLSGVYSCGSGCVLTRSGTSKVAKAYGGYVVQVEKRTGNFRPWAKGVIRIKRGNWGGISFNGTNFTAVDGHQFEAGGGAGFLVKVKGNTFFNTGFTATRAINGKTASWDLSPSLGFVVKF